MVQISVFAYKFRGKNQKKGLRRGRKIFGFVLAFNCIFRSGTRPLLTLGGHKQYLGGHRPLNALQWHRVFCFFLEHNPRLWGTFLAWGSTSSDLGGTGPKNAPLAPVLHQYRYLSKKIASQFVHVFADSRPIKFRSRGWVLPNSVRIKPL